MDGHPSPTGDKTDDLVSRHRIAALGEPHSHIVDPFDHNTALRSGDMDFLPVGFRDLLKDRLVRDLFLMLFLVLLLQAVDHLAFLEPAVADGCKDCIPVAESVFLLYDLLVFRFQDIQQINALAAAVGYDQLLAADDIIFFKLLLEPLVDLVLRLRALDDIQPVTARSL